MSNDLDYDNICEKVGVRVQDGDHLVKSAIQKLTTCTTWRGIARKALVLRDKAVREEKFLTALIYDTIHTEAQTAIEEE